MSPAFPDAATLSRAFFEEAIRHLEDAHLLHINGRYAAAITSVMKASELALKSACILEGAMGWWKDIQTTHKVLEAIGNNVLLSRLVGCLDTYQHGLRAKALILEKLIPEAPKMSFNDLRNYAPENTEYPFLMIAHDAAIGDYRASIECPQIFFDQSRSQRLYNIARDVLLAITAAYPMIASWALTVSPAV